MAEEYNITLPEFCNLLDFEKVLREHLVRSRKQREVRFDFSKLRWIGVLQVSLIYGWVQELISDAKKVYIDLPDEEIENPAINLLFRVNFFDELINLGANFSTKNYNVQPYGLAAFKSFSTIQELLSYKDALLPPDSSIRLLNGGFDVDLVRDGDLRDILLHELGENAFIHGDGKCVRFAVSEFPVKSTKISHSLMPNFEGSSYIEVVVSDSGSGLLKTLRKSLPPDYIPHAKIVSKRGNSEDARVVASKGKLGMDEKAVAYAFEFSSTCDEENRKKRIAHLLKDATDVTQAIPTGLFYVSALAKTYGGHILVRTGKIIVSIDFTSSTNPKISIQKELASIPGTHVMVRVPRERSLIKPAEWEKPRFTEIPLSSNINIPLGKIWQDYKNEDFLVYAEKQILEAFSNAWKKSIPLVTVLCDGLHVDTKTFSILLMTLAVADRRRRALILFGLRHDLLDGALAQWDRICKMKNTAYRLVDKVHGYQSFPLVSNDLSKIKEFGDKFHPDSTNIVEGSKGGSYLEFKKNDIYSIYEKLLKAELQILIEMPPVKHGQSDRYYLIEGKYYTQTFYEIRKLMAEELGNELASNYLNLILRKNDIGTVFTISEPLYTFSDRLGKYITDVKWFKRNPANELASFMEAFTNREKGKKFLILADVICKANEISKFLALTDNFDDITICCFVDGREEELTYITVKKKEKPHMINVLGIHKTIIKPIDDLPSGVDLSQVLIIDRRTHSPTSYGNYDRLKMLRLQPVKMIEEAIGSNVMFQGHLSFKGKHYSAFINIANLFLHLRNEIEAWLDATFENLGKRRIEKSDLTIFFLDEQRGWENIIVNHISTKGVAKCEALRREQLFAPPPDMGANNREKFIWFILPAIASGETTRQCLEYGIQYNPDGIHISIILARMDSTRWLFYQNLTGYRDVKVGIETLNLLPLPAYASVGTCPMCDIEGIVDDISRKAEGYKYLYDIINVRSNLFRLKEFSIDDLKKGTLTTANQFDKERIIMRVMYEEADRNFERRKEFGAALDKDGAIDIFIEMVGYEFRSLRFSEDIVKRTTYTRYDKIKDRAEQLFQGDNSVGLSIHALFGIHRLFPDMMSTNLKKMFYNAVINDQRQQCEDLIFLALVEPERYSYGIRLVEIEATNEWIKNLIRDVRKYPYWDNVDAGRAVESFFELLWLLRRSTEWGSGIEDLRAISQIPNYTKESIIKTYNVLERHGIKKVQEYLNQLKLLDHRGTDGLWNAIKKEGGDLDSSCKEIDNKNDDIKAIIQREDIDRNALFSAVNNLDKSGKAITLQLEKLFTNPLDAKFRIEEIKPQRWPSINIRFVIASNQPGVFMGLEDLARSLSEIIENANKCILDIKNANTENITDYWLEFNFCGYTTDRQAAMMIVRDNLPWSRKLEPTGGMKLFVQYCHKYSATYDFIPDQKDDPNLKIRVIYKIDDKRGNHV